MAKYAIGDIQGCYQPFVDLLAKINYSPSRDTIYLVGDLVNRGKESLEVLRFVYNHQDNFISVLGNHDLYLLARYTKVRDADIDDTLHDLIVANDANKLIDWLRHCPLVYIDNDIVLVHAGIHPLIDLNIIKEINELITTELKLPSYGLFIKSMFGNKPYIWNDTLPYIDKLRFILNSTTRMRFLQKHDYAINYKQKGDLLSAHDDLIPWFQAVRTSNITQRIIFGHWASLGFYQDTKHIGLDTGCVWGRQLTAINLETNELFQVQA